jgi:hypothetical protein
MVRANGANTNGEIHAPLSPIRRPEDRGSMHPPQPRETGCVARWPLGQRRVRAARRAGRLGWRCARLLRASPDGPRRCAHA